MFAYVVAATAVDSLEFEVVAVFLELTPAAELGRAIASTPGRLAKVLEFAVGQVPADYRQVLL